MTFKTAEQGWYGLDNGGNPQEHLTPGNSLIPIPAVMVDQPSSTKPSTTWSFETSAIARSGPQANTVYASVKWGFAVDDQNAVKPLPTIVADRASTGMNTAIDAWNKQATGPEANRTRPDQQPLPNVH